MPLIDCPVCSGRGTYEYTTVRGYIRTGTCTACRGSGKMELAPSAFERRTREYGQDDRRCSDVPRYKQPPEVIAIIRKFGTIRSTLDELAGIGIVITEPTIKRLRLRMRQEPSTS